MTQSAPAPVLVWFRYDLRLDDHPALCDAAAKGPVIGLFVLDPALDGRPLGGAARWWLHHSLTALSAALADRGIPLLMRAGDAATVVAQEAAAAGVQGVVWNRGNTPWLRRLDQTAATALARQGTPHRITASDLMVEPEAIRTGSGGAFKVFTPFWKALQASHRPAAPQTTPDSLRGPGLPGAPAPVPPAPVPPAPVPSDWALLPTRPDWAGGLRATWTPGEAGAHQRLHDFLQSRVLTYGARRDFPADPATSRLSPFLRFGEISARRVWQVTEHLSGDSGLPFLRELAWREFNHHILFQAPDLHLHPLRPEFRNFPWREDPAGFAVWCQGKTGYPIVDAGMRELWHTGWMHNRVRMIVGSFLVKDLLVPWTAGEDWFWDTLVDACPANNPGNWQWVSGCGADAAPYFRVFNPVLQGEKFDPDGAYVRRWVPELARKRQGVHRPAEDGDLFRSPAYPPPMVDHGRARDRALAAFAALKEQDTP